jgi:hypothetical protein
MLRGCDHDGEPDNAAEVDALDLTRERHHTMESTHARAGPSRLHVDPSDLQCVRPNHEEGVSTAGPIPAVPWLRCVARSDRSSGRTPRTHSSCHTTIGDSSLDSPTRSNVSAWNTRPSRPCELRCVQLLSVDAGGRGKEDRREVECCQARKYSTEPVAPRRRPGRSDGMEKKASGAPVN